MPDVQAIHTVLKTLYPDALCSLEYGGDPWRLLIAARLSAQCTDERVNIVCVPLFEKYPDAAAMAEAEISEVEEIVRPCGLFRTKAQSCVAMSKIVAEEYGGRVPETMEELLALPGVGRKIANLILGDCFGQPGIVADTHCIRICGRLGFYDESQKDPLKVERILSEIVPREEQAAWCHRMVLFGRDVCSARNPKCESCPVREWCAHGKQNPGS
ncbi:MAG: endonuclease III [Ruminococcaceae bacterium]|jgi:endonuclease-3|nr:endonuclease III [Oscillospiraceae bacterium]